VILGWSRVKFDLLFNVIDLGETSQRDQKGGVPIASQVTSHGSGGALTLTTILFKLDHHPLLRKQISINLRDSSGGGLRAGTFLPEPPATTNIPDTSPFALH